MGLLAIGVILVAVYHLASPLPLQEQPSSGRANFYLVGSSARNLEGRKIFGKKADVEEFPSEIVHSRSKRSTVVHQYHYVSEPRIPRFTYVRVYQKVLEPEPEPEPELPPLPGVEERKSVLTEESHSKHESEEHEEEHEEHEEHLYLEEYGKAGVAQGRRPGARQSGSRTEPRSQGKGKRPKQSSKKSSKQVKQRPKNTEGKKTKPKKERNKNGIQAEYPSQTASLASFGHHILVYHPPPPLTYYDGLGLLHLSLGTSYSETLGLIQPRAISQKSWAVPVCDRSGRPLSHINIGNGPGNLQFVPIRGANGHSDWVYFAKDDFGLPHYIHLKNKHGRLNLVNGAYQGKKTMGIIGYDEGGEILIPLHYEKDHFVVDKVVHPTDYILF